MQYGRSSGHPRLCKDDESLAGGIFNCGIVHSCRLSTVCSYQVSLKTAVKEDGKAVLGRLPDLTDN